MNGVAHYLVGLLIMIGVVRLLAQNDDDFTLTPVMMIATIVLAFFSHAIVDALAHFTYHPSESNWSDPIYAGWHLLTYLAEAVFAVFILRTDIRYSIGMLSAVGFDLWDWSIARPLDKYADIPLPGIHWMASGLETFLFGWAPSFRDMQWALLVEVVVVILLFSLWVKLHAQSKLHHYPRPGSWYEVVALVLVFGSLRLLTLV